MLINRKKKITTPYVLIKNTNIVPVRIAILFAFFFLSDTSLNAFLQQSLQNSLDNYAIICIWSENRFYQYI